MKSSVITLKAIIRGLIKPTYSDLPVHVFSYTVRFKSGRTVYHCNVVVFYYEEIPSLNPDDAISICSWCPKENYWSWSLDGRNSLSLRLVVDVLYSGINYYVGIGND